MNSSFTKVTLLYDQITYTPIAEPCSLDVSASEAQFAKITIPGIRIEMDDEDETVISDIKALLDPTNFV